MNILCLFAASLLALTDAKQPNLLELVRQSNASTLVGLLQTAGLSDVLSDQGPFTLIVPTNAAFAKLPEAVISNLTMHPNDLANVLQYHVIKGEVFTFDLKTGEVLTSLNGHSIRVYVNGNNIYFNQAKVESVDVLQASNGVIYLVDEPLNVPEGTIDQIMMNPDYEINEFLQIVKEARLESTLNRTSGPRYTVFVPSNAAMQSLDSGLLNKIKSSYTLAREIADYHIHPGTLHTKSLTKSGKIFTMYRGHTISLTVASDNIPKLNDLATIEEADIEAENGVVHVISHVLIPSTLSTAVIG